MQKNNDRNYKWHVLSCTSLGALLTVLNSSTITIALPIISTNLHASLETVIWTLMIYMLSITVLVPMIGRIADIKGRKKLYVSGFAVFTISSLLCALVQNGGELIAARFLQSVGGSLMVANSTTLVADAFPGYELGRALGINSMVISVGAVIGPIVGGILTSWDWRWVFLFNFPLGLLGTIWAARQLKEVVELPRGQRLDWQGAVLFTTGFSLILLALTFGNMVGWKSPLIMISLAASFIILAVFVYVEGKTDQPMLDLSLFKQRLLAAALASVFLNSVARGAVTFLMIFFFEVIWGIDPLRSGIMLTPFAAAMFIITPISGALSDNYGSRGLSCIGLLVSALGLLGLSSTQADTSILKVMAYMFIMGAGSGFFFPPNTNAIMGAVVPERRGIAAGTRVMLNNAGMVVSIALGLAFTASSMSPEAMQGLLSGTHAGIHGILTREFLNGLHHAFWVSFAISLVAAVVAYMRGPRPNQQAGRVSS